ncbi:MAG: MmcB family DNA repair protein [Beijerinckiaceae bacterium]|nr:MmcB family DNA repair protein [Beijerinckiaceae bacterium]MCZ8299441.1 MmcB family DNA repair protein [Beijerinckiaceae bacterium]
MSGGPARDGLARLLSRGLARHFAQRGLSVFPEMALPNGRRADLVALSDRGAIHIIEIKSSVEDFRADTKWRDYLPYCEHFYFATHPDMPLAIFPEETGLILADGFGAEILREAPPRPLAAATRKALTIRLARVASARLSSLLDPEGRYPDMM